MDIKLMDIQKFHDWLEAETHKAEGRKLRTDEVIYDPSAFFQGSAEAYRTVLTKLREMMDEVKK